jgi:cyanophycinase-like exopeptidase
MPYFIVFAGLFSINCVAQNYTSYFTGDAVDAITQPAGGVCLMGGATEDDNAMTWFLEQANGGDILVIRASGSDGYNDYFFTDLGVTVNSVETIVFNDGSAADEPYVQQKILNAEAIWMAGGDQWNYISYWRDTPIDSLINLGISERNIVIGGTSAGMAVLGEVYFTAENGTVTSAAALNNPYAANVTIDSADFLNVPFMDAVITDTHYDNPDRRGRHFVFIAKQMVDFGYPFPKGIACEEYVAVCVDTFGIARVYGGYPTYDEQAYFIQVNCELYDNGLYPETCVASTPLTWKETGNNALMVYKVNGTATGSNYLDLTDWQTGSGGTWQFWGVDNGTLNVDDGVTVNCVTTIDENAASTNQISVYPNPTKVSFAISIPIAVGTGNNQINKIVIYDLTGRVVKTLVNVLPNQLISVVDLEPGTYLLVHSADEIDPPVRFVVE